MNFFSSRNRRNHRDGSADERRSASRVRLSDPVAQAMSTGDRRSADVMWFGGVTFRMDGEAR